jgi:hypothetical protein
MRRSLRYALICVLVLPCLAGCVDREAEQASLAHAREIEALSYARAVTDQMVRIVAHLTDCYGEAGFPPPRFSVVIDREGRLVPDGFAMASGQPRLDAMVASMLARVPPLPPPPPSLLRNGFLRLTMDRGLTPRAELPDSFLRRAGETDSCGTRAAQPLDIVG